MQRETEVAEYKDGLDVGIMDGGLRTVHRLREQPADEVVLALQLRTWRARGQGRGVRQPAWIPLCFVSAPASHRPLLLIPARQACRRE